MKINEVLTTELLEKFYRYQGKPLTRSYAPRMANRRTTSTPRKSAQSPKIIARPTVAPVIKKTVNKSILPKNQNSYLDFTMGNNFKLNDRNIKPELTDKEIQSAMRARNNDRRTF